MKVKQYDYFIVGSELYGAPLANLAHTEDESVLVVDPRPHVVTMNVNFCFGTGKERQKS